MYLAQVNVATALNDLNQPGMAAFMGSLDAFTFKTAFPESRAQPVDLQPEPFCVGWA